MKIMTFENEAEFLSKMDGKVYAIYDTDNDYICDLYEDDLVDCFNRDIIVPEENTLTSNDYRDYVYSLRLIISITDRDKKKESLFDKVVAYLSKNEKVLSLVINDAHKRYWKYMTKALGEKLYEGYSNQSLQYTNISFQDGKGDDVAVFKSEWRLCDVLDNMRGENGRNYVYTGYNENKVIDLDVINPTQMTIEYELDSLNGTRVEILKTDLFYIV